MEPDNFEPERPRRFWLALIIGLMMGYLGIFTAITWRLM